MRLMDFATYEPAPFYDEMFDVRGRPRVGCELLARTLTMLPEDDLVRRQHAAERALLHMGITFNVYGHEHGTEKILPFDLVPRVVPAREWATIERGLIQRTRALNMFIDDVYHARRIVADGVVPRELVVRDGFVWMRTTRGMARVDVIYRRVDETYLDPTVFRPDSALGVSGLMSVVRAGRLTLANAPGTGVADDKVIYAYVPEIIRYYLAEDAILPNVPTFVCFDEKQRSHVLANLDKLVVKAANESGGYGMLIGPQASAAERAAFAGHIRAEPRNYIAQPLLGLSRVPTLVGDGIEGRHVDLRPYILHGGDDVFVLPGGLTRVALKKGSYVVNSSQGGGTKDTWVLADDVSTQERLPC